MFLESFTLLKALLLLSVGEDTNFQINLLDIYLPIVSTYAYTLYAISNKNVMKNTEKLPLVGFSELNGNLGVPSVRVAISDLDFFFLIYFPF